MSVNFSVERWRKRLETIRKKIDDLHEQEKILQDTCPHPGLTYTYKGDTGNWCPHDDRYWLEWQCPCCEKRWTTDQTNGERLKHPHAVEANR